MKARKCIFGGLLCALSISFTAIGAPLELKLGQAMGEGHHYTVGAAGIKKAVEKATDGQVIIHVYSGGQLASGERELVEGLQLGTVDITVVSIGPMAGFDKNFMFFTMPYLFRDEADVLAIAEGKMGRAFEPILEKQGIKLLGWTMDGVKAMTNSKRPINSLADLKGLKIRCMENPLIMASWKALGAVPTPMSIGEAFTALQQGTVDGQTNGTANIYVNKYYEVQKYMTLMADMITPAPYLMALSKFEAMSPELQKKFMAGFAEGIQYQRKVYDEQAASAIKNMEAKGIAVATPDLAEFKKAVQPVYDEFLPQLDPQFREWVKELRARQ
jgi:tripartite ATP-independent transporter DctP family solute receptor